LAGVPGQAGGPAQGGDRAMRGTHAAQPGRRDRSGDRAAMADDARREGRVPGPRRHPRAPRGGGRRAVSAHGVAGPRLGGFALKIQLRSLAGHLEGGLAPVYLVAGDEPLLVANALDAIRAAARRAGFETRDLHVTDRTFQWDELLAGADNLSLFAPRRILEFRMPSPRPGDAGARVLRALAARPDPDRLLIVAISARLDSAAASSQWVSALDEAGVVVEIWPIERAELPRWIRERAARYRLKLTPGAAELLADRVEGHLLAADQELLKLALLDDGGTVDEAEVLESVADSARFDVFRL